ncbi:MAG: aldose 1-epimerase, partial [Clostridiales bacterium]|nr:aldose 1-epimerase [Clostridiales bacterium]
TNCHLHGMLHEMEFEMAEIRDSFVKCVFEKPYLDFPHSFRIEMTYRLSADGLEQRTKITNLSEENMPNFLGFHTTFNIPFLEGAETEDVRLYAEIGKEIERDRNYLPTGKLLSYDDVAGKINSGEFMPLEKVISRHCEAKNDGRIELTDIKHRIKLIYENDEKFGWWLFYNGSADDYICLEPMTCMANCQNSPFDREYAGFDSIAPYSSKEYVSRIFLEEMM